MYKVDYTKKAQKQISKLDKSVKKHILNWIGSHLVGCDNPRIYGKQLSANRSHQWAYRVGDYRIVTEIHDMEIVVVIVSVAHKKEVYEKEI